METEDKTYVNLDSVPEKYQGFFKLTTSKIKTQPGFAESRGGHIAGNLCQWILSFSLLEPEKRVPEINRYLKYVEQTEGSEIIDFLANELQFPLPQESFQEE